MGSLLGGGSIKGGTQIPIPGMPSMAPTAQQQEVINQNVQSGLNTMADLGLQNSSMANQQAQGMAARQYAGFGQQNFQDQLAYDQLVAQIGSQNAQIANQQGQALSSALGGLGSAAAGLFGAA